MTTHPLNRRTWMQYGAAPSGQGAGGQHPPAPVVPRPPAPVGIVHIGLGAFHRAHQAWYTHHAPDAPRWGIAAFTGRSPRAAELLAAQDGLYTLVERGPEADRVEVIDSIVEVWDGSRVDRLVDLVATPAVAVVTLTITESGYRATRDGRADLSDPVVGRDVDILRTALAARDTLAALRAARPVSALGRLLAGLEGRRRSGAGPITVVPCDNVASNGAVTRQVLLTLAGEVDAGLHDWVATEVAVASTTVDRITPRLEDADIPAVREAGWLDAAPVVTEPFSEWVIQGDFPAGRPDWSAAGARFVDDVEPWERRKLWLLNGAHSILAWSGLLREHLTIADAVADPACRSMVDDYWAEASAYLPDELESERYCSALLERWANRRIHHRLEQVATDSATKVGFRAAAVAARSLDSGRPTSGTVPALAAWVAWVLRGSDVPDSRADDVAAARNERDPVTALLRVASPRLAEDARLVADVRDALPLDTAREAGPDRHRGAP